MSTSTSIEWTDATWNPTRGCSRVSEGCRHCYAETVAARFSGPGLAYEGLTRGGKWTGEVRLIEERLSDPLRWKTPRRIFVNSMSDLFHERVPDGWVMRCLSVMARTPQHTYQILTKRPERMRSFFARWADLTGEDFNAFKDARGVEETLKAHPSPRGQLFASMLEAMGEPPNGCAYPTFDWMGGMIRWPDVLPNVWLGVSVEDQATADARIPLLLQTPAAVRFLSVEPLLERVDLPHGLTGLVQWVIVGGESGPGARPCHLSWIRRLRDQCREDGLACFVKQVGTRAVYMPSDLSDAQFAELDASEHGYDHGPVTPYLRDRKGGDIEEFPEDLRVREFPRLLLTPEDLEVGG